MLNQQNVEQLTFLLSTTSLTSTGPPWQRVLASGTAVYLMQTAIREGLLYLHHLS